MKSLINNLLGKIHFFILAYIAYSLLTSIQSFFEKKESIEAKKIQVQSDIRVASKKISELKEFEGDADQVKIRVEEVAKNIEKIQQQLPAFTDDYEITKIMNHEISTLNIMNTTIIPELEEQATYFIAKDYRIIGEGTFLQILVFFERLSYMDRIFNLKKLSIENNLGDQKGRYNILKFTALVQAFRQNPEFKVDRGF